MLYEETFDCGYETCKEGLIDILPAFKNLLTHARMYASEDGVWPTIIKQAEDAIRTLEQI